jgi:hypothetical protein
MGRAVRDPCGRQLCVATIETMLDLCEGGEEDSGPAIGVSRTLLEWPVLSETYGERDIAPRLAESPQSPAETLPSIFTCGIGFDSCLVRGVPRPQVNWQQACRSAGIPSWADRLFRSSTTSPHCSSARCPFLGWQQDGAIFDGTAPQIRCGDRPADSRRDISAVETLEPT